MALPPTADLQVEVAVGAVQEVLQRARDGEGVPAALLDVQSLLHQQRAVGVPGEAGQEDLRLEVGVLGRGPGVHPQGGLQHLDALTVLLQELEGEPQAGVQPGASLP